MNKPKVLIVEDDPIVASDIKHKIKDFGYEVVGTAASGEQAIEEAGKHHPSVVLMDITLEGKMDGVQAADAIRTKLSIPVVYLTAHSDQATVQRAKLTLPYGYVLKPIREVELKIALEMAIYTGNIGGAVSSAKPAKPHGAPMRGSQDIPNAERSEIIDLLKSVEPFIKVHEELLNEIAANCTFHEYRPLEVIAMEGEQKSADGFIVVSGRVAMLKTSLNGRELVVQLVGPKSSFGLLASLDSPSQDLTSRAQIETKLLHVPKTSLLYLLREMPELYADFLAELSRRMNGIHNMARALAHDKVDVRIAATLTNLIEGEKAGKVSGAANEINMSRQELANLVGTTVETAIRVTRGLEDTGVLELSDHRLIRVLQPEKLRTMAQGADF